MAMGRQKDGQGDLMVSWSEMPRSPGHVFYDRLQSVLIEGGFEAFAEASCRPYYAVRMGAPSVPPGRYFRMHLVGYFEGIESERGLEWRCSDSLSLRAFLRLGSRDRVPDHSWLSRSRTRLPHEVHAAVFDWVLVLIAEAGLIKGERIGVDASTMEANAALRNIVRRDNGEGYREMLERLARESGVETPTAEDLARLDRKRKGLNSSLRRSMALVVRADFHWLLDRPVKVKSLSPASARLSATALHFSRHLRTNALRRVSTSEAVSARSFPTRIGFRRATPRPRSPR